MKRRLIKIGQRATGVLHAVAFGWALLGFAPGMAHAHESPLPSAALVQRDDGHITLSIRLDAVRALHQTLLPDSTPTEALARLSTLEPERFARSWAQATQRWSEGCAIGVAGQEHQASRWAWPPASDVQALVRQQLASHLTGGHAEHGLLNVQAEFHIRGAPIAQAQLRLPAALRPLSLTTLRPRQQWVADGDAPISMSF